MKITSDKLIELENFLSTFGVDYQDPNKKMRSMLMLAAKAGDSEVTEFLLSHKANPDLRDNNGATALMHAADKEKIEVVRILLNAKADYTLLNNKAKTVLYYAALGSASEIQELSAVRKEIIRLFFELLGGDVDAKDGNGVTILIKAVGYGCSDLAEYLIEYCSADVNSRDGLGRPVLTHALDQYKSEVKFEGLDSKAAKLLLERGANPLWEDTDGMTVRRYMEDEYRENGWAEDPIAVAHSEMLKTAEIVWKEKILNI